jgi:hypothetical protein
MLETDRGNAHHTPKQRNLNYLAQYNHIDQDKDSTGEVKENIRLLSDAEGGANLTLATPV